MKSHVIPIKLVQTSKMPGPSFGLPTAECKTGAILRKKKGTICNTCYACRGRYGMFKQIKVAQYKRLHQFNADPNAWVDGMVEALDNVRWFRWFDSGDVQSTLMLSKIAEVCRKTPWCNHWLATRERKFVRDYLRHHNFPDNLVVRLSATYPDVPTRPLPGTLVGNVHHRNPPTGFECQAPSNDGRCGDCRACWDKEVKEVSYAKH